ncbi:dipeptidase [Pontibacter silvestris]|uniref:Dipeptidase n=1 Tax=Pontibacter silvestris TaxID=2305183 RepID=A0ABW4WUN0_9BACT|nr:membrane dipeptidase [Pontibacter silvestris]MCC9136232.1 membrane dipeptidase [Pontibacter silvestris]
MDSTNQEWSRRKFIATVSGAGAAMMLNTFSSLANNENADSRVAKIIAKTTGIDTHNHIDVPFKAEDFICQKYDLAGEIKKSGLSAICMTFQVDRPKLTEPGEAYKRFISCLDEMDEILKDNNMKRALNFLDLKKARKQNKPIVIQSVEGGHFIEGQIERLEVAYNRGVRHLGLLHDNQSFVPLGDIYTNPAQFGGLTEFGANVIKECNRLGILVDLAHCSNETIDDALKVTTKPILISHTGLNTQLGKNEKMAKMMMPRLISKEQAKIVANAGGVIGLWTHLADTPLEYAQNIRAMVDVIGTEHVCIGTDTKMAVPANSNAQSGNKTNTAWKNEKGSFFYTVVDAMLKSGFTENEIAKIGGKNYSRIFDKATSV